MYHLKISIQRHLEDDTYQDRIIEALDFISPKTSVDVTLIIAGVGTNSSRFYSLTNLKQVIKETLHYWDTQASPELKEFVLSSTE